MSGKPCAEPNRLGPAVACFMLRGSARQLPPWLGDPNFIICGIGSVPCIKILKMILDVRYQLYKMPSKCPLLHGGREVFKVHFNDTFLVFHSLCKHWWERVHGLLKVSLN